MNWIGFEPLAAIQQFARYKKIGLRIFERHPVQPIDDCSQGQTVVAYLAVVLRVLASCKQPRRDRVRVLKHYYLVVQLFQRDVVIFASSQQQNVLRDGRGDIRRLELPECLNA